MQALPTQKVERHGVGRLPTIHPVNYKKEAGRRLKTAREDKRLTLAQLSDKTGGLLSTSRLGNYEQGTRWLGVPEALALGTVLGVKASHLLCVDGDEGDMTPQETKLLRDFRALPERDRNHYARRIEVLAMAYKEPVPDERLSPAVRRGAPKKTSPK